MSYPTENIRENYATGPESNRECIGHKNDSKATITYSYDTGLESDIDSKGNSVEDVNRKRKEPFRYYPLTQQNKKTSSQLMEDECVRQAKSSVSTGNILNTETIARLQEIYLSRDSSECSKLAKQASELHCSRIKEMITNANYVWIAYQMDSNLDLGLRLFVMVELLADSEVNAKYMDLDIHAYKINELSGEPEYILNSAENFKELSVSDLNAMRTVISQNADKLMADHKHLSIIKPSSVRSKDFILRRTIHREKCIAFYVRKKGFIPVGEKPFDRSYSNFPVDVREGVCYAAMFNVRTEDLKMGCKIFRMNQLGQVVSQFGTLGGFIDHPEYGICGLTCAHVLLDANEITDLQDKGVLTWLDFPDLYVCLDGENNVKIGQFVKAIHTKGNGGSQGFEVAIFQIEDTVKTSGTFWNAITGGAEGQHVFMVGKTYSPINCTTGSTFVKFGAVTGKTTGKFTTRLPAVTVRLQAFPLSESIILHNQIEIRGVQGTAFAEKGDSGSLVMATGRNGETLCVGVLEGVTNYNTSIVSPIGPVLEKLNVSSFKCFQQDELLISVHNLERTTQEILTAINRRNCNLM